MTGFLILLYLICSLISYIRFIKNDFLLFVNFKGKCAVIGAKEEEAFFTGDGKGKPLGVLAATGGAETGVTAASATAVTADELMDLYYSLKSPYRKKSVWVLNDSTIKAIRKLKDNNGQYLWQPSGNWCEIPKDCGAGNALVAY